MYNTPEREDSPGAWSMHIYLDNNATTGLLPEVWEAMRPFLTERSGNPASSHRFGRQARQALEDAREQIAALLDADAGEVIFTSGATEANNLALFGLASSAPGSMVTSAIEHPSVIEPVRQLAGRGYEHRLLPVTRTGSVDLDRAEFPEHTRLVSVMLANHETGALQPIEALVQRLDGRAPLHCDAAAAAGKVPIAFHRLGVTALTVSGHKLHGPPGIGVLLLARCAKLQPLLWGGHQQQGRRPGTEPVALAVGLARALAWSEHHRERNHAKVSALRQRFLDRLRGAAAPIVVNGPTHGGLPHTINVSFPGCAADVLLMKLDLAGVACSTGSACSSGSLLPSPVLQAMGLPADLLRSAMRFSLSSLQGEMELDEATDRISKCANDLRRDSADAISGGDAGILLNASR
jgi:cysteine desulfurase